MAANATATSRNTSNSFTTLVPSSGTITYTSVCALYSVKKYPEAQNMTIVKPLADPWGLLRRASRLLGVSIILPAGRFLTPLPFRKPVTVCIGKALEAKLPVAEPSDELIDKVHAKLINELVGLYHRHRERCGFGGVELAVV